MIHILLFVSASEPASKKNPSPRLAPGVGHGLRQKDVLLLQETV